MPAQPTKATLVNATLATTISPAQLTANQNDYDPTGFGTADEVRLDTDASRTITGFAAPTGTEQTRKTVINVGSNDLVLAHQGLASAAANRIVTADTANLTLTAGQSATLSYDATTTRWRVLTSPGGGAGLTAPANPADDGKVAVGSSGDLAYLNLFTTEIVTDAVTITTVPGSNQEHIIEVNTVHANWDPLDTVTLPASPATNSKYTICDGGDNAGTEGIRIDPNGKTISGRAGTLDITIDGGSVTLYYNGTQYLLMG